MNFRRLGVRKLVPPITWEGMAQELYFQTVDLQCLVKPRKHVRLPRVQIRLQIDSSKR